MKYARSGVLRGSPARALHVRRRSACSRTAAQAIVAVALHEIGVLLVVILTLGLHVNLSAGAPRRSYRIVAR
jgi:hypothetical protein